MLANLLAIVVGLGSFTFYMAAFFVPEVHRKSDFLWSGIGLFYALVLWFCAGQMTGAVLLGQTAAVSLVLWLGWQTLLMRRTTTPSAQQTPVRISRGGGGRPRLESSPRGRIDLEYEFVEDASGRRIAQLEDTLPEPPEVLPEIPPVEIVPAAVPEIEATSIEASHGIGKDQISPSSDSAGIGERQPAASFNPFKKAWILAGWLKEVVTDFRKPKPAKPMIELPPRPRSIPKVDKADINIDKTVNASALETSLPSDASTQAPNAKEILNPLNEDRNQEQPTETAFSPESPDTSASDETQPDETQSQDSWVPPAKISPKVEPSSQNTMEDEDANWPDEDANWPDDL
ncbi:MAG: Ycf66 family protein [Cyanobacteria bacterium J06635_1]